MLTNCPHRRTTRKGEPGRSCARAACDAKILSRHLRGPRCASLPCRCRRFSWLHQSKQRRQRASEAAGGPSPRDATSAALRRRSELPAWVVVLVPVLRRRTTVPLCHDPPPSLSCRSRPGISRCARAVALSRGPRKDQPRKPVKNCSVRPPAVVTSYGYRDRSVP